MRIRVRLGTLAILLAQVGCGQPGRPAVLETYTVSQIEWPPSSPANLEIELKASALDEDDDGLPDVPLAGDTPCVCVHKGKAAGLSYLEVVLGDVDPDARLPMIVTLHGRGDRPRIPGGPFSNLPHPVRVIVPRGPKKQDQGYAWLPVSVTSGKMDVLTSSLSRVSDQLAGFVARLEEMYPTEGKPIVTGFSQGGILSFTLAVTHPEVLGLALPNAGWLPSGLVPTAIDDPTLYPRIRSIHGTADPIIRIGPTRDLVLRLQSLGLDAELVEFEGVKHVMTPEMDAQFHAWLVAELMDMLGPVEPPEHEPRHDVQRPDSLDSSTADDAAEDAPLGMDAPQELD